MIISKTPFRISFCGGGSDLPAFFKFHDGCVISTTIDKYVYIAIQKSFSNNIVLKYSKTERVDNAKTIKHKIFKKCLEDNKVSGVEITSMSDIPKGTGMGSSSSFTVGLLNALNYYMVNRSIPKAKLASEACQIELQLSENAMGKQDQYAVSYGGLNYIVFKKNGEVRVTKINISDSQLTQMNNNLFIYYIGGTHNANMILKEQSNNIIDDIEKNKSLIKMCEITKKLKKELSLGNLDYIGTALHQNWLLKKTLCSKICNKKIDSIYEFAIKSGATGGKLLGAGGGGFMLFYVPTKNHSTFEIKMKKYTRFYYKFEKEGSRIFKI